MNKGQVAVVTGGASGIGFGLAEALASRGVRIILSDVREASLADAARRLVARGAEVLSAITDVADPESVEALAEQTVSAFGRVDLVCNNAGVVSPAAPMWDQELHVWQRMIDIKVMGVVHGVRAFAPHFLRQASGHFLNTASSGGLAPLPGSTPYTGTMHAVVGLTETLDEELRAVNANLGATVLCPGLVDTPLGRNSAELGLVKPTPQADPEAMRKLAAAHGGILTPREVADAALDAIESGRLHVAPGGGVLERTQARIARLLTDLTG